MRVLILCICCFFSFAYAQEKKTDALPPGEFWDFYEQFDGESDKETVSIWQDMQLMLSIKDAALSQKDEKVMQ